MNKGKSIRKWIVGILLISYLFFIFYKYQERVTMEIPLTEKKLMVVTSFYPMYLHTKVLAEGADIEVVNMANNEVGCLHDYTLTTEDAKKLYEADIFIINGLEEEQFLKKVYVQNQELEVINASYDWVLEYEKHLLEYGIKDEHSASDEVEEHGHEGHEHGPINDHIWLSLEGAMAQVEAIATKLSEIDPTHKELYEENKKNYLDALQALKKEYNPYKEPIPIVTVHDTFSYLAEELNLSIVATIPEGTYENPSPAQIEAIIHTIKETGAKVIFTEERYKDLSMLKIIQEETGCQIQVLDAMTGARSSDTFSGEERVPYIERMRKNIQILSEVK